MSKLKCWKKDEETKRLSSFVIPAEAGIFIGGGKYASHVVMVRRRGHGKYWDSIAIDKFANTIPIADRASKTEALSFAQKYMKAHDRC